MKHSIGKILGGSLIGMVAGFFGAMMSITANPFSGVVFAWLYAWAGVVPAGVFALTGLGIASVLGGEIMSAAFALAVLVPAVAAIVCIRRKMEFKKCMGVSVAVQIGSAVAALGVIWLSARTDLVGLLMQILEQAFKSMPIEVLNQWLNPNALQGAAIGAEEMTGMIDEILAMFDTVYRIGLPGMLLSNCLLAGIFNVAVPVWVWARRGDENGIRRVPVSDWRLPESAAIGMPVCVVLGIILENTGYPGGDSVNYAVQLVFQTLLQIQCMGAFSRLAKKSGASMLMRGLLVIGAITFASQVAVYLGAFSLYLGSKGLISNYVRNRRNNNQKEDE